MKQTNGKSGSAGKGRGRVNYTKLDATTEADIDAHALEDGETLIEWTPEQRDRMKSFSPKKVPIALRLDASVLEALKAEGPAYQTRINAILRAYYGL